MVTCNLPQNSGSVWITSDLGGMHSPFRCPIQKYSNLYLGGKNKRSKTLLIWLPPKSDWAPRACYHLSMML